jgi:ArsR family transcriptional regulator
MNVTEITEELNIPQPTTSRHLKILRDRGLVHSQRHGTTITYHLSDQRLIEALDLLRSVLRDRISRRANLMKDIE